jgi:hypothetical protein
MERVFRWDSQGGQLYAFRHWYKRGEADKEHFWNLELLNNHWQYCIYRGTLILHAKENREETFRNEEIVCCYFFHRQDICWSRSRVPVLSRSCELWRTRRHTTVYPSSGLCYEVIALRPTLLLLKKMNSIIMGVSWELKKFTNWKGEVFFCPLA